MEQKIPGAKTPEMLKKTLPLAVALLTDIQSGALDPNTLSTEKKTMCVQFMILQQSYTVQEMANLLQVSRVTIYNYKKNLYQENSLAQLVIDEATIALEMIETAQHAAAKLMSQKKYKDAWTVRRECLEMLQTLGYVKKVEQKLNVKGSIDLLHVLGIEADLRNGESPDNGEEENVHSNGNGYSGLKPKGGSRLEEAPE